MKHIAGAIIGLAQTASQFASSFDETTAGIGGRCRSTSGDG
jgi:hypothetical protein